MPDYVKLAATAERLIAKSGRAITLVKFDRTVETPTKPWRGAEEPRGSNATETPTVGVFVEPSSATKLGMSAEVTDLLKRSQQMIMLSTQVDISAYNEVVDSDSTRWKIIGMEKLRPGETTLLYFVGVKR